MYICYYMHTYLRKNYKRIALAIKMLFFLFGLSMYKDIFSDPITWLHYDL